MPGANETGDAQHSPAEEMRAFDRLPKTLRATLNYAQHDFVQMLDELKKETSHVPRTDSRYQ